MRRTWQLATRNWRTSPGRALAAVISVGMGVATVVTIANFYETARRAIRYEVVNRWLGAAHLTVHPPGAHWGALDASLVDPISQLDNVRHVTSRLRRRMRVMPAEDADRVVETNRQAVDAIGIDPGTEQPFLDLPGLIGRPIASAERKVAVIAKAVAASWGVELGSRIGISGAPDRSAMVVSVVGLFDDRRVAEFQKPSVYMAIADVQELALAPNAVSVIDIMLEDSSPNSLAQTQTELEKLLAEKAGVGHCRVVSAAARQQVLDEAERISRILLSLTAFVALLTSFFIILTTMSMSLFERRRSMGVLRCVGSTRGQLSWLLSIEMIPLGLFGTVLGVLLGMAVTEFCSVCLPSGHAPIVASKWGVQLAVASGMLTTLVSTAFLLFQVCRVTPLAALNPDIRAPRKAGLYLSGVFGIGFLLVHEGIVRDPDQTQWLGASFATVGVTSLYLGYILLTPALVGLLGAPVSRLVGPLLGIRPELACDQFGRAPWRCTGVCWVLMVALSLIVYLGIGSEAMLAVWDFPGRLPEAFVWSPQYVPGDAIERVRQLPGVKSVTVVTDVDCQIANPDAPEQSVTDKLMKKLVQRVTRPVFVAADPEAIFRIFKVSFIEGDSADAKAKLARGGHILIPVQTSRSKGLHAGDKVTITVRGLAAQFEIAGVVQSPALDLAVTAFQAESYMQFAAASAMLGTNADLRKRFSLDVASMFLCDLDLPDAARPDDFDFEDLPDPVDEPALARTLLRWGEHLPNERGRLEEAREHIDRWVQSETGTPVPPEVVPDLRRFGQAVRYVRWTWGRRSADENWLVLRERLTLARISQEIERPDAIAGSVRRLKQHVDRSIRRAVLVLTWLPSLLLPVAAIGIGNLMMVSVHIRARQIAVLRAVGALRSQVIRLVLAEAATLGLLGAVTGLALGLHEAFSDNRITAGLIGFYPEFIIPYGSVAIGIGLTVATCLVAGLLPARRASRDNVVAAMQVV